MLAPIAVNSPRHLAADAPACFPCTMPALVSTPIVSPYQHRFTGADIHRAAQRTAEVAQERPTWPQSRVRALVAREMNLSTTQLRYLLRQAIEPAPDADAPPLPEATAVEVAIVDTDRAHGPGTSPAAPGYLLTDTGRFKL